VIPRMHVAMGEQKELKVDANVSLIFGYPQLENVTVAIARETILLEILLPRQDLLDI
jgi:hypothetical protein